MCAFPGQLRGGEEWLANPALPEDIVRESVPGEFEASSMDRQPVMPHYV